MKAILVHEFGGPAVMKLEERARSDSRPGRGPRAHARGRRQSGRRLHPHRHLRAQAAAAVHAGTGRRRRSRAVGADVKDFKPGDRVYICGVGNTAARRRHLRRAARSAARRSCIRCPRASSFAQGAALGVPYCTAYRALFQRAHARPGETVLVHGATGGVGIAGVELAHARGLTVIGTGGTDAGLPAAREHGADVVVNHRDAELHRRDHARDRRHAASTSSSRWRRTSISIAISTLLAKHGRVVVVGNRGRIEIDARQAMGRDAAILGMTLFNVTDGDFVEIHAALIAGLANGTLNPVVGREIPLADARARARSGDGAGRARQDRPRSLRSGCASMSRCGGVRVRLRAGGGADRRPALAVDALGRRGAAARQGGLRRALRRVPRQRRQGRRRRRRRYLMPRPRDFTTGRYKIRSTETGTMPTDDDLIGSVRQGLYGTAMPGWDRILSDGDIRAVVQYVKSLSPQFARAAAAADRHRRRPAELAGQRRARPAGLRQAAVRQVPRHRRPRHRRGRDHVRGRLAAAAARRRPHRAVDVPRRRDVARHLPALPHRHDRHADAVVHGRGERRRDVGPRQLRRLAGAQAGLGDDRGRKSSSSTRASRRRPRPTRSSAARTSSRRSAARCATRRSTSRSACSPA